MKNLTNLYTLWCTLFCFGALTVAAQSDKVRENTEKHLTSLADSLELYRHGNSLPKVEAWLDEFKSLLSAEIDSTHHSKFHFYLGTYYFNKSRYNMALSHLDTSRQFLIGPNKDKHLVAYYSQMGNTYTLIGKYSKALENYQQGLDKFNGKDFSDSNYYYGILLNTSNVLSTIGDYENALINLSKARQFFERQESWMHVAVCDNNIGELYRNTFGEMDKAKKHYQLAIANNLKHQDFFNLAQNYNNLALVFKEKQDYDSAEYYFEEAIRLRQKHEGEASSASNIHGLATLYREQGNYKNALTLFRETLRISQENSIGVGVFYSLLSIGETFYKSEKLDSAEKYFVLAHNFAKTLGINEKINSSALALSEYYEATGRFDSALKYYKLERITSDSIQKTINDERLTNIKANFERELAERENQQLRDMANIREQQISHQRLIIWGTSAASLIFIALAILLVRSLRLRQKVNRALAQSKTDLEAQNAKLHLKEQSLEEANQMKDRILSVLGHDLRSPLASLTALLGALSAQEITREELLSFLDRLKVQTDDSLMALENVLSWAQAQRENGGGIKAEPLEVKKYLEEILQIYAPGKRAKNLIIDYRIAPNCEVVNADPSMFRSMIGNLLSNAIKFSLPSGHIDISIEREKLFHRICIKDQGTGISDTVLKKINAKGKTGSRTGTAGEIGTGIGLTLVKDFVEMHGGKMSFSKNEPKGTVACLKLPLRQ